MSRICLECAAIFLHLPLTVRCRLWGYTRAMMIKRILTICAAVTAGAAGTSLALAQGYPVPPAPVYSTTPQPYPRGGYPADYRRAPDAADLDLMDDDEAPNAQSSTALPPPGPVLSPDDPRYGRLDGPPPVIYSDRPAGAPQTYSDRGNGDNRIQGSGFIYPDQDNRALRPPEAVGAPSGVTGSVQPPPVGADGK